MRASFTRTLRTGSLNPLNEYPRRSVPSLRAWNESKYLVSRARTASEIRRKFRRRLRSSRLFRFREETSRIRIILLARTPSTWLGLNEQGERDGSFLQPLMETYEHLYNIRETRVGPPDRVSTVCISQRKIAMFRSENLRSCKSRDYNNAISRFKN